PWLQPFTAVALPPALTPLCRVPHRCSHQPFLAVLPLAADAARHAAVAARAVQHPGRSLRATTIGLVVSPSSLTVAVGTAFGAAGALSRASGDPEATPESIVGIGSLGSTRVPCRRPTGVHVRARPSNFIIPLQMEARDRLSYLWLAIAIALAPFAA